MTKSELIELIAASQTQLSSKDVELAIKNDSGTDVPGLVHGRAN